MAVIPEHSTGEHPSAAYKVQTLQSYLDRYQLRTLVETGLYLGHGSGMLVNVPRYIVIDCQPANVTEARAQGFDARLGDSAELLPALLDELDRPALFWLDAHGIASDFPGFPAFPLFAELEAIAGWQHSRRSVVLIDDLAMMGEGSWQPLVGAPELNRLRLFVDQLDLWHRQDRDEIMRLTPRFASRR